MSDNAAQTPRGQAWADLQKIEQQLLACEETRDLKAQEHADTMSEFDRRKDALLNERTQEKDRINSERQQAQHSLELAATEFQEAQRRFQQKCNELEDAEALSLSKHRRAWNEVENEQMEKEKIYRTASTAIEQSCQAQRAKRVQAERAWEGLFGYGQLVQTDNDNPLYGRVLSFKDGKLVVWLLVRDANQEWKCDAKQEVSPSLWKACKASMLENTLDPTWQGLDTTWQVLEEDGAVFIHLKDSVSFDSDDSQDEQAGVLEHAVSQDEQAGVLVNALSIIPTNRHQPQSGNGAAGKSGKRKRGGELAKLAPARGFEGSDWADPAHSAHRAQHINTGAASSVLNFDEIDWNESVKADIFFEEARNFQLRTLMKSEAEQTLLKRFEEVCTNIANLRQNQEVFAQVEAKAEIRALMQCFTPTADVSKLPLKQFMTFGSVDIDYEMCFGKGAVENLCKNQVVRKIVLKIMQKANFFVHPDKGAKQFPGASHQCLEDMAKFLGDFKSLIFPNLA